jgi:hypothetical protein
MTAKSKTSAKKSPAKKAPAKKPQAERLLEAARKARQDQSGQQLSQAMGKITMARNARKPSKMG